MRSPPGGQANTNYRYDPYGKAISALGSHATINPLRYRGYVFDHETGLYYLQSRYYDPTLGRFLNADALASTGQGLLSNNMFSYCMNNPTNFLDYTGMVSVRVFSRVGVGGEGSQGEQPNKKEFINYVERSHKKTPIWEFDCGPFGRIGFYHSYTVQTKNEGYHYIYYDVECANDGIFLERTDEIGTGVSTKNACVSVGGDSDLNLFVDTQHHNKHTRVSVGVNGIGFENGIVLGNHAIDFEIAGGMGTWLLALLLSPVPEQQEKQIIIFPTPI